MTAASLASRQPGNPRAAVEWSLCPGGPRVSGSRRGVILLVTGADGRRIEQPSRMRAAKRDEGAVPRPPLTPFEPFSRSARSYGLDTLGA
jgi:hypothetical protein